MASSDKMGGFRRMDTQQDEKSLKDILCRNSIRFGQFTLASGQTSDVYVDAKLTTWSAEAIPLVGRVFLQKLESLSWHPNAVGGLTTGADAISLAIARESLGRGVINAFFVRKEPKKHGRQKHVEGIENPTGLSVVIIDDVCTTGSSTALAIRACREAGMTVIGAICLVDRQMGAAELIENEHGCEFSSIFRLSELRPGLNESDSTSNPLEAGADVMRF
jgi:orotate phosphoribosyltransferase